YTDLAMVALYEGDPETALALTRAGAAHPVDKRDRFCANHVATILCQTDRLDEARASADDVLGQAIATGMPSSIAMAYPAKGLARARSNPAEAIEILEQGVQVARRSGTPLWANSIVIDIADLQARTGEPRAALESFRGLLADAATMRDSFLAGSGLSSLILLFARLGQGSIAATLYGALPKSIEKGVLFDEHTAAMERVRAGLGDAAFKAYLGRGAAMTLSEASRFARDEVEKALTSGSIQ